MAQVAKYILKKAVQLNELEAKQKKLAQEIAHWLKMSGVLYADVPPYSDIVVKLCNGEFESEADIEKALSDLLKSKGL